MGKYVLFLIIIVLLIFLFARLRRSFQRSNQMLSHFNQDDPADRPDISDPSARDRSAGQHGSHHGGAAGHGHGTGSTGDAGGHHGGGGFSGGGDVGGGHHG
jgi:hypothetical protein